MIMIFWSHPPSAGKALIGLDKWQIVRSWPRPETDCVYTPVLDKFLLDLVPKCKAEDKVLGKSQDLLLDVAGPIASQGKLSGIESLHAAELHYNFLAM